MKKITGLFVVCIFTFISCSESEEAKSSNNTKKPKEEETTEDKEPKEENKEEEEKDIVSGSLSLEEVLGKIETINNALVGTGLDESNSLEQYNNLLEVEFTDGDQYTYKSESDEVTLDIVGKKTYYSKHQIDLNFSLKDENKVPEVTKHLVESFNSKFGEPKIDGDYNADSGYFEMKYVLMQDEKEKAYITLIRKASNDFRIYYQVHKPKDEE